MVHVMRDTHPTTIGDEVTVGHSAVLHGCTIEDRVLDRHGRGAAERRRTSARTRSSPPGRCCTEGTRDPAAVAGDGPARQGEARAHRRGGAPRSAGTPTTTSRYRLDYMAEPTAGGSGRLMAVAPTPARGMRDFLPDDVRRRAVRHRRHRRRLPALRLRAARDAGGREHRDAARQVRRGRRPPDLQDPEARRGRQDRRGRPGAALRPHRAAGARRRRVPGAAAEVLQALPGAAGVARRPPAEGPLPRVLPVRRRRHRVDVDGGRGGAAARAGGDVLTRLGFTDFTIRLNHRRLLAGDARRRRRARRALHGDGAGRARQARQDRPRAAWPTN